MTFSFWILLLHCRSHLLLQHKWCTLTVEDGMPLINQVLKEMNEHEWPYLNLAEVLGHVEATNLKV